MAGEYLAYSVAFSCWVAACAGPADPAAQPNEPVDVALTTPALTPSEMPVLVAAARPSAAPAAQPSETDPVGIAECDDYLTNLSRCNADASPEVRDAMLESARQMKTSFRELIGQGHRDVLVTTCKAALDALVQIPTCAP